MPVFYRTVGHQLDTVDLPDDAPTSPEPCTVETMAPDGITISRRTLTWLGAGLLTLFTGGQAAVSVATADDGVQVADPAVTALTGRVDSLTTKMDRLTVDGATRDQRFSKILSAVLIWQLEQDRYYRETRQPGSPPRSAELEAASQRLRDLATE